MANQVSHPPFRSAAWFLPVCLLIVLAGVAESLATEHFPAPTSFDVIVRSFVLLAPLMLAVVLTQRIVLARSRYSPGFAAVAAVCLVALLCVIAFLLLLVFAMLFAPSSLV